MTETQPTLLDLWPCDICAGSRVETDPETGRERPCRICHGTGMLDYPPPPADSPFAGLDAA